MSMIDIVSGEYYPVLMLLKQILDTKNESWSYVYTNCIQDKISEHLFFSCPYA